MENVSTSDQRWQITVEWSPFDNRFTLALDRWERARDATQWALEDRRVLPMVRHGELEAQLDKVMLRLAEEMRTLAGADLRPF